MKKTAGIFIKTFRILAFAVLYIADLIKANILIAREILSPNPKLKPGIISVELDVKSDQQILALANLISMTPGSLTMDISQDRKYLFIHEMYLEDIEQSRKMIKQKLESRILKFTE